MKRRPGRWYIVTDAWWTVASAFARAWATRLPLRCGGDVDFRTPGVGMGGRGGSIPASTQAHPGSVRVPPCSWGSHPADDPGGAVSRRFGGAADVFPAGGAALPVGGGGANPQPGVRHRTVCAGPSDLLPDCGGDASGCTRGGDSGVLGGHPGLGHPRRRGRTAGVPVSPLGCGRQLPGGYHPRGHRSRDSLAFGGTRPTSGAGAHGTDGRRELNSSPLFRGARRNRPTLLW